MDSNERFDCLRQGSFVRSREANDSRRANVIPVLFEVADEVDNEESQKVLREFAQVLVESPHDSSAWTSLPYSTLLQTFGKAILRDKYWLSPVELLCLAEISGNNLMVCEILDSRLNYAGHVESDATAGFGIVALQSNRQSKVRSHVSRLVPKS